MNYIGHGSTIALLCMIVSAGTHGFSLQTAGRVLPIFVDYDKPPGQLDQFMAQVDAAAVVRVEGLRFASVAEAKTGRARDVTTYDLRVVEVLKPHGLLPPTGGAFTLTRAGDNTRRTARSSVVRL